MWPGSVSDCEAYGLQKDGLTRSYCIWIVKGWKYTTIAAAPFSANVPVRYTCMNLTSAVIQKWLSDTTWQVALVRCGLTPRGWPPVCWSASRGITTTCHVRASTTTSQMTSATFTTLQQSATTWCTVTTASTTNCSTVVRTLIFTAKIINGDELFLEVGNYLSFW